MIKVLFTNTAIKQLTKIPPLIAKKALAWAAEVENKGLLASRLIKGKHDEPLKGKRQGQRSVRLNKQWRLIYSEITLEIIRPVTWLDRWVQILGMRNGEPQVYTLVHEDSSTANDNEDAPDIESCNRSSEIQEIIPMIIEPAKLDSLMEQYPEGVPAEALFEAIGYQHQEASLGSMMREWRQCEGWTLTETAQKLGISKQFLSEYERGHKLPSIKKVIEIATTFEVDPASWLKFRLQDELRMNGYDGTLDIFKIA
jgi:proteic killer suppression protein